MYLPLKKTLYTTLVAAMLFGIGWYAYAQSETLIQGPHISIEHPQNGTSVSDSLIEIRGVAEHIAHITLNDRPIFVDDEGRFAQSLLLLPGYNIIEITAQDRFDRSVTEHVEVVLNE